MKTDLEGLTLSNLAKGQLEERFQQQFVQVARCLEELPDLEDKKDVVQVTVELKIHFAIPGNGAGDMMVTATPDTKRPRPKAVGDSVFYRKQSGFTVWANEPRQEPLPLRAVPAPTARP